MIFKIDQKSMIIFILISSTADYLEIIQRNSILIRHTLTLTSPIPKFKFKKLEDIYPGEKITPNSQNAGVNVSKIIPILKKIKKVAMIYIALK